MTESSLKKPGKGRWARPGQGLVRHSRKRTRILTKNIKHIAADVIYLYDSTL